MVSWESGAGTWDSPEWARHERRANVDGPHEAARYDHGVRYDDGARYGNSVRYDDGARYDDGTRRDDGARRASAAPTYAPTQARLPTQAYAPVPTQAYAPVQTQARVPTQAHVPVQTQAGAAAAQAQAQTQAVAVPRPLLDKTDAMEVGDEIVLRRFRMESINTDDMGKRVFITGVSGTGKSNLVLDLLKHNRHVPAITVVNPSEGSNHKYGPHVHPGFIQERLNPDALLHGFQRRQEDRCANWSVPGTHDPVLYYRDPSAVVVLDDIQLDPKLFKHEFFRWALNNSRNFKTLVAWTSQFFMRVPNDLRANFSHMFTMRMRGKKNIQTLHEEFYEVFDSELDFRRALAKATSKKGGCLVVDMLSPSNELRDRVFHYVSESPEQRGDFRVCPPWVWAQADEHYNERWNAPPHAPSAPSAPPPRQAPAVPRSRAKARPAPPDIVLAD